MSLENTELGERRDAYLFAVYSCAALEVEFDCTVFKVSIRDMLGTETLPGVTTSAYLSVLSME